MRGRSHEAGTDVVVVGGGLIGTACAWRLAQGGLAVAQVVGDRSLAASRVAAGMLAPVSETTLADDALLALNRASIARWAAFADEVAAAAGRPSGLRRTPTVSVAADPEDADHVDRLAGYLEHRGVGVERLGAAGCRALEPLLAPDVQAGLVLPDDWSCDGRVLLDALAVAAERAGVRTVEGFASRVQAEHGRVARIVLADGRTLPTGRVVLANGAWAGRVEGLPPVPVRPVKGQALRLDPGHLPCPGVTVRAFTRGSEVYLVPRASGREVVVGATSEELDFDDRATAGGVHALLHDALRVLPVAAGYALRETSVGWRPATPDDAPILGGCDLDGLTLATGHHRNGVLLTPVTADVTATHVLTGTLPEVAQPFTLRRFDRRVRSGTPVRAS